MTEANRSSSLCFIVYLFLTSVLVCTDLVTFAAIFSARNISFRPDRSPLRHLSRTNKRLPTLPKRTNTRQWVRNVEKSARFATENSSTETQCMSWWGSCSWETWLRKWWRKNWRGRSTSTTRSSPVSPRPSKSADCTRRNWTRRKKESCRG